ncbi:MAG: PorV/PorQ family protein [Elusimicrobia bacterium]|nr:PorV/PorQ family protein [Elusimicrobiota bacterium]
MGLLLLSLFSQFPLQADFFSNSDQGGRGPAALKRETGVRALGLGGAFVGVADDASAVDWNPAGLQQLPQSEFLFMHEDAYADQFHEFAAYAHPFWKAGKRRTWGGRFSYLSMDPIDMVEDGADVGQTRPWESILGLSYAESVGGVSVGVSGKIVRQEVAGQSGQAYALDVGLLGKAAQERLAWGVGVANMGTKLTLGEETILLPLILRSGASYVVALPSKKSALLLALEFDAPVDDKSRTGIGIEYAAPLSREWRGALRGGYRTDRPSGGGARFVLGAGLERGSLRFNYAFTPDPDLGASHRFDLAVRFGTPLKEEVQLRTLLDQARADLNIGHFAHGLETLEKIHRLSPKNQEARNLSDAFQIRFAESLDPDMLFQQGEQAFKNGRYEKSADFFRKLVLVQPDRPGASQALAQAEAAVAQERRERAKTEVARGRQREVQEQILWAKEEEKRSHWETALERWQKAFALDRNTAEAKAGIERCRSALYALAEKAEASGELEKAQALFNASQDGLTSYRSSASHLAALDQRLKTKRAGESRERYAEGSRAFASGDWVRAQKLFEEALQLTPEDKTTRRALERVREELNRQGGNPQGK